MKVSNLSYQIAYEISSDRFLFQKFYDKARPDQYIMFSHINIIYSWNVISGHRIIPACYKCCKTSEYNFAGYGTMFLKHNGIDQLRLLNGRYRTMEVYCQKHIKPFSEFNKTKPNPIQLQLF